LIHGFDPFSSGSIVPKHLNFIDFSIWTGRIQRHCKPTGLAIDYDEIPVDPSTLYEIDVIIKNEAVNSLHQLKVP